jgi:hypothetical protein
MRAMNDNPDCKLDPVVVAFFDRLVQPLMRNVMRKCGLPEDVQEPTMIDEIVFLISKSGLTADERAKLAMQIGGLCQIVARVPDMVQTRKGLARRKENASLLAAAVDRFGRLKLQGSNRKQQSSKRIAEEIEPDVNKYTMENGGRSYDGDSIRKEVGRRRKIWATEQLPS